MPLNVQAKIDLINSDPKFSTALQVGPLPQDDFLGGVSIGADYSKYLQMRRDPHVRSVLQRRRHSILGRRVIVDIPHGSKVKNGTAQEFEARLLALKYENLCGSLLNSGQLIGFAVAQLDWAETDGIVSPSWQFVPQDRFLFAWHEPSDRSIPFCDGANHDPKKDCLLVQGYELRLLTRNNPFRGERCPKNRFLVYTFDADESPWGLGLGYSIYPWYVVKREAMKAWLLHSDRLGSPPVLGLTPEAIDEGDAEYRTLLRKFEEFLKAISPNAWARLPHGFEAKVMDLVGSAGPEVHEQLIKTANDEISKVVLGEVPFSDKATGSYAANISQVEDREASLIDADVNVLDDACHSYLWIPYAELNYPNEPVPVIRRETRADDRQAESERLEAERKKIRIDQDKIMQDLGYRVKPELIGEVYGQEYVDASSIQDTELGDDEAPQALAAILGPRTDTLLNFLQTLSQTGYPRDNAIAVVMNIFGIPRNIAETLVPGADEPALLPPSEPLQHQDPNAWEYRAVIDRVVRWNGLEIGLEHPPGSVRFPGASAHKLKSAYGHLRGLAPGGDKKAPDCYLHRRLLDDPDSAPKTAWRIQQLHPDTGEPDEDKIMLGYESENEARDAYLFEMPSERYFGGIAKMPLSQLQRADYAEPVVIQDDEVLSDEEWDAIANITDDDINDAVATMGTDDEKVEE